MAYRFGAYCFRFILFFAFLASFQCFLALLSVLVLSGNGGAGRTPTDEDLLLGTCCWHLFLAGV